MDDLSQGQQLKTIDQTSSGASCVLCRYGCIKQKRPGCRTGAWALVARRFRRNVQMQSNTTRPRPKNPPWWKDTSPTAQAVRGHKSGASRRRKGQMNFRDFVIGRMAAQGYSRGYIAARFGLTVRRIRQILSNGNEPEDLKTLEGGINLPTPALPVETPATLEERRCLSSYIIARMARLARCRGLRRLPQRPPYRPKAQRMRPSVVGDVCRCEPWRQAWHHNGLCIFCGAPVQADVLPEVAVCNPPLPCGACGTAHYGLCEALVAVDAERETSTGFAGNPQLGNIAQLGATEAEAAPVLTLCKPPRNGLADLAELNQRIADRERPPVS